MATRKPRDIKPETYPEVNPELMAIVNSIYARWTPEEFGNAIWQYRREHDLIKRKAEFKQQMEEIAQELEDEQ
jgi:dsDNA-specific endonuclease/ATPase MutS2